VWTFPSRNICGTWVVPLWCEVSGHDCADDLNFISGATHCWESTAPCVSLGSYVISSDPTTGCSCSTCWEYTLLCVSLGSCVVSSDPITGRSCSTCWESTPLCVSLGSCVVSSDPTTDRSYNTYWRDWGPARVAADAHVLSEGCFQKAEINEGIFER
jgi:hypothetical protein